MEVGLILIMESLRGIWANEVSEEVQTQRYGTSDKTSGSDPLGERLVGEEASQKGEVLQQLEA